MELLDKIFGKNPEQVPQPVNAEEKLVPLEQHLANHHSQIEEAVSEAIGEKQVKDSTIPTANMTPGNPLGVIQGLDPKQDQAEITEAVISNTMPESYKKSSVGDTFGSSMKNTIDHLTGLDSNRYTSAGKFTEIMQKKAQEQTAILQPGGELKKAA